MDVRVIRDRGEVSSQVVIVVPVVVLLMLMGLQAALVYHSAAIASAAAGRGAAVASGARTPGLPGAVAGVYEATAQVADLGGELVRTPTVGLSDGRVTLSVEVRVPRLVPFFPSTVVRTVVEPIERTTLETER